MNHKVFNNDVMQDIAVDDEIYTDMAKIIITGVA